MNRVLVIGLMVFSAIGIGAQELTEGTWGGTVTRLNPNNPRPQRQKFALEFKKAADPHWAWRPGSGDTWTVTVIHQQGRSQAMDLQLGGEALSFSYRLQDAIVTCQLARQADASFEGDCVGANAFRLSLTPSKTPAK